LVSEMRSENGERVNNPFDFGVKAFPNLLKLEVEKSEIKGGVMGHQNNFFSVKVVEKVFNLGNEGREGKRILDVILCDKLTFFRNGMFCDGESWVDEPGEVLGGNLAVRGKLPKGKLDHPGVFWG